MIAHADVALNAGRGSCPGDPATKLIADEIRKKLRETILVMNKERLQSLARDLRKTPPRSPRETLGGFVIGARMLDKARADLLGINGEYNFYPCGLGAYFWKFTGLDAQKFKEFVATGATDAEVDKWIRENAVQKDKIGHHPLEQRDDRPAAVRSAGRRAGVFRRLTSRNSASRRAK